jgi:GT2 family glycosyltransferase
LTALARSLLERPTVLVTLIVWYAVLLTDGPLSTWILLPSAVLSLVWLPHARNAAYRFAIPMLVAVVVVPIVWSAVGIAYANNIRLVADQAAHFLLFGLYFPMRWATSRERSGGMRVWLLPTLLLATLTLLIWVGHELLHFTYGVQSPILQTALAKSGTGNYRVFLKGDLFFIPAAALMWLRVAGDRRPRVSAVVGLFLILAALVVSGTRGLWIAAAVSIAWTVIARRPSGLWLRSLVIGVGVVILAVLGPAAAYIQQRVSGLLGTSSDVSTQIHTAESAQLLGAFWMHPVLGSGLGATLASGYIRAVEKPYLFELTYHQMLFQLGILGTIAFLFPLVLALVVGARTSLRWAGDGGDDGLLKATVGPGALAGLLVASATNPYLFSAPGAILIVITLTMIDSALDHRTHKEVQGPRAHQNVATADSEPPLVLTIVVNFNMGGLIEGCLSSLERDSARTFAHHIVIWENGPERHVAGHDLGSRWTLGDSSIWYTGGGTNLGYARGINTAYARWREASKRNPSAVHCCNPDTISRPNALSSLFSTLRSRSWGAIGPNASFDDGRSRPAAYPPLTPALVVAHFLRLRWMRRFGRRLSSAARPQEVAGAIDGSFIVVDGHAWTQIGGLDDDFGISSDDHDLCNRIRAAGWRVGIDPSASVSHNGAAGRSETPLLSRLDEVQGSVRYVGKYYPHSLAWVRWAIWGLLRFRREPLSKELAWWARRAPLAIGAPMVSLEENYLQALRSMDHRIGAVLASRLESEWWRRRAAASSSAQQT